MDGFAAAITPQMKRCCGGWSQQDRRRDAAVEAATRGQGGGTDSARGLAGAPHTMHPGLRALEEAEDAAVGCSRQPTGGWTPAASRFAAAPGSDPHPRWPSALLAL